MAQAIPLSPDVTEAASTPSCSLTAQFSADGKIVVTLCAPPPDKEGYFTPGKPVQIKAAATPIQFEFCVERGDASNARYPRAGILIERDDEWDGPWDEEVVRVLGGAAFPFGTAPLEPAGNADMGVLPRNCLRGVFSGPLKSGKTSQLMILGVSRSATSAIAATNKTKYLSLWLPKGATGYVKICLPGGEEITVRSDGTTSTAP